MLPVYCVKDVTSLYLRITPPWRGSRRSRAARRRLMRWGVDAGRSEKNRLSTAVDPSRKKCNIRRPMQEMFRALGGLSREEEWHRSLEVVFRSRRPETSKP